MVKFQQKFESKMKKVVSILGARPQFIKAAVLSRIIRERGELKEVIIHTGQHFDENMSGVFFDEMDIPKPEYNLEINSLAHGAMTGRMLEGIERVLLKEHPDLVVVYGDTNSTLAGALAAKKLHIPVAHVESGLRSFNMSMPEEINRILTDRISDILLCPTDTAVSNLKAEGFEGYGVELIQCGDIMKDSMQYYSQLSDKKSSLMESLDIPDNAFVLATIHRQENTDEEGILKSVFKGLNDINKRVRVVMPMHPRTRLRLDALGIRFQGLALDPLGYFDMLQLLKNCQLVITDSGGLQKEAYFNQKPCVIVREETEWQELLREGYATLAGRKAASIYDAVFEFLKHRPDYNSELYGDKVGNRIYKVIKEFLDNG